MQTELAKLNLHIGQWYRCSNNGFEFHVLVVDLLWCTQKAKVVVEDWQGQTTHFFHWSQMADWYMERIA